MLASKQKNMQIWKQPPEVAGKSGSWHLSLYIDPIKITLARRRKFVGHQRADTKICLQRKSGRHFWGKALKVASIYEVAFFPFCSAKKMLMITQVRVLAKLKRGSGSPRHWNHKMLLNMFYLKDIANGFQSLFLAHGYYIALKFENLIWNVD